MIVFLITPQGTVEVNCSNYVTTTPEDPSQFKKICESQAHPCSGCGAIDILRHFYVGDTYTPVHNNIDDFGPAFVHMCHLLGKDISQSSLKIDLSEFLEHFNIDVEYKEVSLDFQTVGFNTQNSVIFVAINSDVNVLHEHFTKNIEALPHSCAGCLMSKAIEMFNALDQYSYSDVQSIAHAIFSLHCSIVIEQRELEDDEEVEDFIFNVDMIDMLELENYLQEEE